MSLKCIWGHCKISVSQTRAELLIIIIIARTLMVCRVTARLEEWQGTPSIWVTVGFECGRGECEGVNGSGGLRCRSAKPQLARLQEFGLEAGGWDKGSHWRWSSNTREGHTLLKHHCRRRETSSKLLTIAGLLDFEAAIWSLNCVLRGLAYDEFLWHKLQGQKRREHNPSCV